MTGIFIVMKVSLFFMVNSLNVAIAGDEEKATADVVVRKVNYPVRVHSFSLTAHEMSEESLGKGFIPHEQLTTDGKEVIKEEHSLILYVIGEGNEAWFMVPIVYDSENPDPTRWFVLNLDDAGGACDYGDEIWFSRVADNFDAVDILPTMTLGYFTHEVLSRNLKFHSNKRLVCFY